MVRRGSLSIPPRWLLNDMHAWTSWNDSAKIAQIFFVGNCCPSMLSCMENWYQIQTRMSSASDKWQWHVLDFETDREIHCHPGVSKRWNPDLVVISDWLWGGSIETMQEHDGYIVLNQQREKTSRKCNSSEGSLMSWVMPLKILEDTKKGITSGVSPVYT